MREHRFGPKVAQRLGACAVVAAGAILTGPAPAAPTAAASQGAGGADAPRQPVLRTVGNFVSPLFLTAAPSDSARQFVVEQEGRIRVVKSGRKLSRPFLDISRNVSCCGERGLLGLAFAPDYATSRRFYVSYTDAEGASRIVEYLRSRSSADLADVSTARSVLTQPRSRPNHNGGHIAFGPDRLLHMAMGDGGFPFDLVGEKGNGQDLGTLLGKILRIDPRKTGSAPYRVPSDNPFTSTPGARAEIWAFGLRNPWRFSFDRLTGGLSIGDVGRNTVEEINWSRSPLRGKGVNFGWRAWEGTLKTDVFSAETAPGSWFPVLQYRHGDDGCSVTGGYVIRDRRFLGTPLWGRYVYGDFCSGKVWTADMREGRLAAIPRGLLLTFPQLASFGEDSSGRIHLVSLGGRVARLDPS